MPPIVQPAGPGAVDDLPPDPFEADDNDADDGIGEQPAQVEPSWPDPAVAAAASGVAHPAVPTDLPPQPAPPSWPEPPTPSWPTQPVWPPTRESPVVAEPQQRTPAGTYLPPSAVLPPGEALPLNGKNGATSASEDAAQKARPSLAERLALGEDDGPLGLPATMPARTIALGAAIAGLGFLLPWAEIVIGSSSMGGFLDQWGLAAPGHPLVLLVLIGLGALAVANERLEVKVSAGLPAIVVGAVLLGLVFPYLMGPFQETIGVYVTLVGALIMIVGGLLASAARRHEPEGGSV
jgi:hypothetical protein